MMTIIKSLLVSLPCLPMLMTCMESEDELIGRWSPMMWTETEYAMESGENYKYYVVPPEGGDFCFVCRNYKPWLTTHAFYVDGVMTHSYPENNYSTDNSGFYNYKNEWVEVCCKEDSVMVKFEPNMSGTERRAYIGLTAGDVFDDIPFVQYAKQ